MRMSGFDSFVHTSDGTLTERLRVYHSIGASPGPPEDYLQVFCGFHPKVGRSILLLRPLVAVAQLILEHFPSLIPKLLVVQDQIVYEEFFQLLGAYPDIERSDV